MKKRILSILLALTLIFGIIPFSAIPVQAAGATLSELEAKYPHNKYWNGGDASTYTSNPCSHHGNCSKNDTDYSGWCGCNSFKGLAIQCHGFAYQLASLVYGGNPYTEWTANRNLSALDSLKAGDIVRYKNKGHSIFVIAVNGDTVTYADCNSDEQCKIRWNQKISKATLKATFTYVDPAPYEWNTGTTHTHSYAGYNWEAAHPHKCYKTCSTCGATKYIENEYYTVSTCSLCSFTQDSKYGGVKGFKAYPCVTSNFEVKTSDLSTRGGEIYTTDYCTINELYTNGWCKVTFPLDSGGTKVAYTQISKFIKSPSTTMGTFTAQTYMNLYSTSSMGTKIFRVYPNDNCITIGTSGSATQVFMPHSDGYYVLGWVKTSEIPGNTTYSIDSRYPTPFKCRVLSSSKVPAALSVGGARQSDMNVYVDDDCVIQEVYTNGWCKFTCPWSDGSTKTLYLPLSEFINANIEPYTFKATQYTDTYYKSDKATKVGWIDEGDSVTVVSTSGNMTQAIYPADVGMRCGWANSSALTTTYTVTFNANGGSGAPAKQSKTPGTALTLSSTKPTRTGYTFVGWSTSSSATSAQYSAGSIYTDDSSITLYAVWRKQSFTITYNANGGANAPGAQTQTYGTAITVTNSKPEKAYDVTFNANGGEVNTNYYSLDCSFASWNTKSNGSGTTVKSGASYTPNANVTLYAIYSNPTLGNYPIPFREGYTFNGWYTAKTGGTRVDETTAITGNTTLYAQWSAETYSVVYYDDGSSNLPVEQTKTYGQTLTLSSTVPVKSGYTFKGWATEEGSSTVVYAPGAQYTQNEWVVLFAVWQANTYTVKYNANGGTGTMSNSSHTYDVSKALNSNAFTKTGCTFLGWSTNSTATSATYTNGQSVKNLTSTNGGTVTLYAVWHAHSYTSKVTKAATCTTTGVRTYTCSGCSNSYTESIAATGHKYTSAVTAPTCTEKGYTTYTCSACKDTYKADETTAKGHNYVGDKCSVCGDTNPINAPTINVSSSSATAGSQVKVAISLKNNPGLTSMLLKINYDTDKLELVSVEDSGNLGTTYHSDVYNAPYTLNWVNDTSTTNYTYNGEIVVLTFKVLDDAEIGETPITVSCNYENYDIIDKDMNPIEFKTVNGSVNIIDVLIGDVNEDGKVNQLDRVILTRYIANWAEYPDGSINLVAADVNCDGKLNQLDRVILTRYIAKWDGYETLPYSN